jgi:hypothetical protein
VFVRVCDGAYIHKHTYIYIYTHTYTHRDLQTLYGGNMPQRSDAAGLQLVMTLSMPQHLTSLSYKACREIH